MSLALWLVSYMEGYSIKCKFTKIKKINILYIGTEILIP